MIEATQSEINERYLAQAQIGWCTGCQFRCSGDKYCSKDHYPGDEGCRNEEDKF